MKIFILKNYYFHLFFCLFLQSVSGQINTQSLSLKQIPPTLSYQGKIEKALTWTDKQGKHIVRQCVAAHA